MVTRTLIVLATLICAAPPAAAADEITKETFGAGGKTRTYYLLVPDKARMQAPAPLVVLLHGSGRDGRSLMDKWEGLAKQEGILLVAPDSIVRDGWEMLEDGPHFHQEYDIPK